MKSREWHLVRRPAGRPVDADVALVTVDIGEPGTGAVVVRNLVMSVEPYMRGRMDPKVNYAPSFELNEPMRATTVGVVVSSAEKSIPVGALVKHDHGWREVAIADAAECEVLAKEGVSMGGGGVDPSAYLGLMGLPGMTAWIGARKVAQLRAGDVVFVSSAAGAVGSAVIQIAKQVGCTVIGSAGTADKVQLVLDRIGADAAFNYRDGPAKDLLAAALAEIGATGIDVYFDNVGGEQLEAAIRVLNDHARIALCGMISMYNSESPVPGPSNLIRLIWRRATMTGFLLRDYLDAKPEFEAEMRAWMAAGALTQLQTTVDGGIEAAWQGFLQMLDGRSLGKTVVPLALDHGTFPRTERTWHGNRFD